MNRNLSSAFGFVFVVFISSFKAEAQYNLQNFSLSGTYQNYDSSTAQTVGPAVPLTGTMTVNEITGIAVSALVDGYTLTFQDQGTAFLGSQGLDYSGHAYIRVGGGAAPPYSGLAFPVRTLVSYTGGPLCGNLPKTCGGDTGALTLANYSNIIQLLNGEAVDTGPATLQFGLVPTIQYGANPGPPYITMQAVATPYLNGTPITLAQAEAATGFTGFNFVQVVAYDSDDSLTDALRNPLSAPWIDPPINGYPYDPGNNHFPFYCGANDPLCQINLSATNLQMMDTPSDPNFYGCAALGVGAVSNCGVVYLTALVGKNANGSLTDLYNWTWGSDYTGCSLGTSGPACLKSGMAYLQGDSSEDDSSVIGGAYIISPDVNLDSLPLDERLLLAQDGIVGVPLAGTVPEPSTWALTLLGFTGLGFAGYRASRKSAALAV